MNCKGKNCNKAATQGIYCDAHFAEVTGTRGGPGIRAPRIDEDAAESEDDEADGEDEDSDGEG